MGCDKCAKATVKVRAIIVGENGQVLAMVGNALNKNEGWIGRAFLPGGKVRCDETAKDALLRELQEELGIALGADDIHPAGVVDLRYEEGGMVRREVAFAYLAKAPEGWSARSHEAYLDAVWMSLGEFGELALPVCMEEVVRRALIGETSIIAVDETKSLEGHAKKGE